MIKCFSISLGCPKNRVDTEKLLGSLDELIMVEDIEFADFVLINTCAFIEPATTESVQTILQVIKDAEDLPKKPLLVVAGCLVGRYGEKDLCADLPEIDLWLDNREITTWAERLSNKLKLKTPSFEKRLLSTPKSYAWLKISDGCNNKCSFCTLPYIRGRHHSFGVDYLKREANLLLDQGVKELVMVAQDLTAWGADLNLRLQDLIDEIINLNGLERLRLMYLYPSGLKEDLLKYLQDAGPTFVPYFDVPLQHADPEILQQMGRPFAHNPYKIIERIRQYFPNAALRTSFITGFPGEEDKHFETLVNFVEDVRFNHLGVFAYQAEDGTKAGSMENQIDEELKEARRDEIMRIQQDISEELLEPYVGEQLDVLVDSAHEEWDGLHVGRAWFQAPEFDGICYVSGDGVEPGKIVKATISESKEYDLIALV